MEEVVLMPRLSDTMTEGVIAAWHKNVGDPVKKGEILAEIETDKATMELESYKEGKLLYQGAKAGEKIQVNDLLAIIGKDGFDVDAVVNSSKNAGSTPKPVTTKDENTSPPTQGKQPAAPLQQAAQEVVNEGRIFASPLAKKMAEEKGIDLKYVKGSGDNGRIIKADINNYKPQPATTTTTSRAASPEAQPSFDEVPVSQMRKTIAKKIK